MRWLRRAALALVVLVALAYAGGMAYLYLFQRSFQYEPDGKFLALGETALKTAEQVEIPTANSERIRGWYAAPAPGKPVIVYYKGNAGSFAREHERFEAFEAAAMVFSPSTIAAFRPRRETSTRRTC